MGRGGADLILTPHSVGEVQRSQLCTGIQYFGTYRYKQMYWDSVLRYSIYEVERKYGRYIYEIQYRNSVLLILIWQKSRMTASGRNQAIFAFGKQPLFSHSFEATDEF